MQSTYTGAKLGKLDQAKADLLSQAAKPATDAGGGASAAVLMPARGDGAMEAYLDEYYRHAAPEDVIGTAAKDIRSAALSHAALAASRPQGTAKVRAHTPTVETTGWSSGHTVVEIITDDMPFLVDSVTSELSRQDRGIHVIIHPVMHVRRDLAGDLLEILAPDQDKSGPDVTVESWIHIEIDRLSPREDADGTRYSEIEADLQRVLRDVREAVEDWPKMRATALSLAEDLHPASDQHKPPVRTEELSDASDLLRWLAEDHFAFLGYREYDLTTDDGGEETLRAVPGTGLGILRADQPMSQSFSKLGPDARAKAREARLLVLTKANTRSTVHRPAYLDYVGVKKFDADGNVVGERRFLGLFAAPAYTESVLRIPVVQRKVRAVIAESGFDQNSFSGKELLQILETYPRDELFQIPTQELAEISIAVSQLQERRRLRLFLRKEAYGRFYSALVYLPRDRYDTSTRLHMQEILMRELNGAVIDYTVRNTESVLTRLHFVVRVAPGTTLVDADADAIEAKLAAATRTWDDDFSDALLGDFGEAQARELREAYGAALPESYKAEERPEMAVADVKVLEGLKASGEGSAVRLYEEVDSAPGDRRFRIYRVGSSVSLAEVLPVFQRMGVEVVDEFPYDLEIDTPNQPDSRIYDFGLRCDPGSIAEYGMDEAARTRFQEAFTAIWTGRAENDRFNTLVPLAGLTWRQVVILRAYVKYLRQGGMTSSQELVENVVANNRRVARLLVKLFEAKFSPAYSHETPELWESIVEEIEGALDNVQSLDEDRILRSLLKVIQATLRTNYFQTGADGEPKPYVSFKLDPHAVPDLPAPLPKFEIWVYSPQVEGVHLRFGKVARGGLRWSDRREDFRTEILGLVKAQMVKNSVIVPVGSKGGFYAKNLPDPSADRDAWLAEGVSSYKTFISGLLDITDNLVSGEVVPPAGVVRHDGDDTYLVVAADKGTATFSDIANGLAIDYGFWLGDAFASGGSVGYDHKGMGITARGAWESVKRHFRELGVDSQSEEFTAVGVGDMSGDVFGNGMLLSEHIRLVAAFDHRHIFLDPEPDAAASFAERQRMFNLPRSSWADYDTGKISAGGGVYPRSAKSIPVSAQVRQALGLESSVLRMAPNDLLNAILKAPVDLFWNGGIGTYVKASSQSHAEVGDKANDTIRINGSELRARVVGEGGNLGFTQLGRIEYAVSGGPGNSGGKINTDAIDNSAGVDTSDHEVNIKILLDQAVHAGDLTVKQRNKVLAEQTDEVARLVLRDNIDQNIALANAQWQAPELIEAHGRLMRRLAKDGLLDRDLEFLPNDKQLAERRTAGRGLTQPELSVLLAYVKIVLADELFASGLPDDPYYVTRLANYFPTPLRETYRGLMDSHPLRREIITTQVVNDLVNAAGISFAFRMREESGAAADQIARAYSAANEVFDMGGYLTAVEDLDNKVSAAVQTAMRMEVRRLTQRASRWFLQNRRHPLDIPAQIEQLREGVRDIAAHLPKLLKGPHLTRYQEHREDLIIAGVPGELASAVAGMSSIFGALDIVETARATGKPVLDVADVYFDLADRMGIATIQQKIVDLPRRDRWQTMARAALRDELYASHAGLTAALLASGAEDDTPEQRYEAWLDKDRAAVERSRTVLEEIMATETYDLATLSVAMRTISAILRATSM
ncbi:NAD-glutamate dehydrogenase [Catenulispora rubra]|uniref:NAD-glutamate dehydrogenase n=1 Tax=Catenulispora rubra TaxID=280293 RepID=UPI0018926235|nr:NAD-glutamate dehydrogenase [Catenulispora rubra]